MKSILRGRPARLVLPWVMGLMTHSAGAYVITFTGTAPTAPETNPPPWSDTISLAQFNVPDASLVSVELILTAALQIDVAIENTSLSGTSVVNYVQGATLTFTYPVAGSTPLTPTVNITTPTLAIYDGVSDGAGASGITYDNQTANANTTITIPSGEWAAYTGAGTVTINVGAILGSADVTESGGKTTWHDFNEALASAEVTVRYTYNLVNEVPEGETLLGGAGLAGLLIAWRWRRVR